MKSIVLVLCALALTQAFRMDAPANFPGQTTVSKPKSLTFTNYTGPGVTDDFLTDLVNFINAASGFYRDDVVKNLEYIKTKLDATYGDSEQNFFVYVQTQQNVRFSWYVWLTFEYVIAGLSDVNIVNPGWSYLVVKNFAPPTSPDYAVITPGSVGPGVTTDVSNFINGIVGVFETDTTTCTCNDQSIVNIGNTLINNYNLPWNTICDATGVTTAWVKTTNGLWGSFKPKTCYYTLFVN